MFYQWPIENMPIPIVSGHVLRVGMNQEVDKDKRQWNDETQDFDEANKLNTNTTESDKSFEHDCLKEPEYV